MRPSAQPGHVCGVSRTLPRPLSPHSRSAHLALALATPRAYRYASLPLGSYDLPPAYVSHQGPPRNLAQLAGASGGGCGARPSRLRAGALRVRPRCPRRPLLRSPRGARSVEAARRSSRRCLRRIRGTGAQGPCMRQKGNDQALYGERHRFSYPIGKHGVKLYQTQRHL